MATAKKAAAKKPSKSEKEQLIGRIAEGFGISAEEAELRALRELAERLPGAQGSQPAAAAKSSRPASGPASHGPLPQRLFLLMDGRGLDGRGMPVEVIDLPCIIGSERHCTVWINSPQIETRHLQITHGDEGWVLEDLGSEHGTFFGGKRIKKRVIQNGDDYQLAGYLRFKTELR